MQQLSLFSQEWLTQIVIHITSYEIVKKCFQTTPITQKKNNLRTGSFFDILLFTLQSDFNSLHETIHIKIVSFLRTSLWLHIFLFYKSFCKLAFIFLFFYRHSMATLTNQHLLLTNLSSQSEHASSVSDQSTMWDIQRCALNSLDAEVGLSIYLKIKNSIVTNVFVSC